MTDLSTRDRLLDCAERLFAENGYAATSLRELTQAASCNLAAVNYHFGSKSALVHEVIARRFEPLNERRIAMLDELEAAGDPTLESILRAFVEPILRSRDEQHDHVTLVTKLLIQLSTMGEDLSEEHARIFKRTSDRFTPAFARALPGIDPVTVCWRITFMVAVVAMSFSEPERLKLISEGRCDASDTDEAMQQMISFLAGGLRAPIGELA